MTLTTTQLVNLGCRDLSITYASLAADTLNATLVQDVRAVPAADALPLAEGDALLLMKGESVLFRGWVTEVHTQESDYTRTITLTAQNLIAWLDALPVTSSSYEREQKLEAAEELISRALEGVPLGGQRVSVELASKVMAVFSGGSESVWSAIMAALRWVPNAATWFDHAEGVLHIVGGRASSTPLATIESLREAELPGSIVSISTTRTAWEVPPVCALRGKYSLTLPEGADIRQPGAFIYYVPKDEVMLDGGALANPAPVQQAAAPWQLVKGWQVPTGWRSAAGGSAAEMKTAVANRLECRDFWGRWFRTLKKLPLSCMEFGSGVFSPMPVSEAYPEDEEDDESAAPAGRPFNPPTLETGNAPANYQEFTPGNPENIYVCHEGQFPASSASRANVKGLRWCRGTLTQWVWLVDDPFPHEVGSGSAGSSDGSSIGSNGSEATLGTATAAEVSAQFAGSITLPAEEGGQQYRAALLTLNGVFISRRRTRYQEGTLAPAMSETEAETPDEPTTPELTQSDYEAALTDYYHASRPVGTHGDITLAGVWSYRHSAELGLLRSVRWHPASGALVLTTGAGGPLGVDAMLQRQLVGRRQALTELARRYAEAAGGASGGSGGDASSAESHPMVAAGATASIQSATQAEKLEDFAVYLADDGKRMINGGILPTPGGFIRVKPQEITDWQAGQHYCVKAAWNRSTRQWEGRFAVVNPSPAES